MLKSSSSQEILQPTTQSNLFAAYYDPGRDSTTSGGTGHYCSVLNPVQAAAAMELGGDSIAAQTRLKLPAHCKGGGTGSQAFAGCFWQIVWSLLPRNPFVGAGLRPGPHPSG